MAEYVWKIDLADYLDVCDLIMEADRLSSIGAKQKLEEVVDRLMRYPGYPSQRRPEDVVVVVPKDARIWIEAADAPRRLPGLPH